MDILGHLATPHAMRPSLFRFRGYSQILHLESGFSESDRVRERERAVPIVPVVLYTGIPYRIAYMIPRLASNSAQSLMSARRVRFVENI